MKNYTIKIISAVLVILLLSLLNYSSAPESATLIESLNPIDSLLGMLFVFNYVGTPLWLSIITLVVVLGILWYSLYRLIRHMIKWLHLC